VHWMRRSSVNRVYPSWSHFWHFWKRLVEQFSERVSWNL
jgi:hypothetical protein